MKKTFDPLTLAYPTPVRVIGTYNKERKPNVAAVAWDGICSSQLHPLGLLHSENQNILTITWNGKLLRSMCREPHRRLLPIIAFW